jgi:adenine-specific DNA-methyltransferase
MKYHILNRCELLPSTRYLGSKRKLLAALEGVFSDISFERVWDPFCGSGSVSYLLKCMGKEVHASDVLQWNATCTGALLSSPDAGFMPALETVLRQIPNEGTSPGFIENTFDGLFFTRDENRFIDQYIAAVSGWPADRKRAAYHVLFQAALAKRPYNLFHRANLYMRQRRVKRSFGNKTTWDTPFAVLLRRYATELTRAWFAAERSVHAQQMDVDEVDFSGADLVYLDPPYMPQKGMGVDYLDYYHLLEGISLEDNDLWQQRILHRYRHMPLIGRGESPWCRATEVSAAFRRVIRKCGNAAVVISYRSDGIPAVDELVAMLTDCGKQVTIVDLGKYTYALSRNTKSREVILVGL